MNINNKIGLLSKQFGLQNAILRILKSIIKPIYYSSINIIMVCDTEVEYISKSLYQIEEITPSIIDSLLINKKIEVDLANKFNEFILNSCTGFYAQVNGEFAGFAFIQHSGDYSFGRKGRFLIPTNISVLKNLTVLPRFRGSSIGKELNSVRISSILPQKVPIGFVIEDNRYAIRNLKLNGFSEYLIVKVTVRFGRWSSQRILKIIQQGEITNQILFGLGIKV